MLTGYTVISKVSWEYFAVAVAQEARHWLRGMKRKGLLEHY